MGGPLKPFDTSKTAALYNDRYNEFGNDVRTVGWGSQQDQILRFEVLFRGFDPRGKTILDIGCGLGDLVLEGFVSRPLGSTLRFPFAHDRLLRAQVVPA